MADEAEPVSHGSRHISPAAIQGHPLAQTDTNVKVSYKATKTLIVPTKTADGDGPMKAFPKDGMSSSRPSSSGSEFGEMPPEELELLARLEHVSTDDKTLELGDLKVIEKPNTPVLQVPQPKFKMEIAKPRGSITIIPAAVEHVVVNAVAVSETVVSPNAVSLPAVASQRSSQSSGERYLASSCLENSASQTTPVPVQTPRLACGQSNLSSQVSPSSQAIHFASAPRSSCSAHPAPTFSVQAEQSSARCKETDVAHLAVIPVNQSSCSEDTGPSSSVITQTTSAESGVTADPRANEPSTPHCSQASITMARKPARVTRKRSGKKSKDTNNSKSDIKSIGGKHVWNLDGLGLKAHLSDLKPSKFKSPQSVTPQSRSPRSKTHHFKTPLPDLIDPVNISGRPSDVTADTTGLSIDTSMLTAGTVLDQTCAVIGDLDTCDESISSFKGVIVDGCVSDETLVPRDYQSVQASIDDIEAVNGGSLSREHIEQSFDNSDDDTITEDDDIIIVEAPTMEGQHEPVPKHPDETTSRVPVTPSETAIPETATPDLVATADRLTRSRSPMPNEAGLHSVSTRAGKPRVTKSVSRTKRPCCITFLNKQAPSGIHEFFERVEFAAAEEKRLRHSLIEISDLLCKEKDAEIEELIETKEALAEQLKKSLSDQAQLQVRIGKFGSKARKFKDFMAGIGRDLQSLQSIRQDMNGKIDAIVVENNSLQKVNHQQRQLQRNVNELRGDTKQKNESLSHENQQLEIELSEKSGQLTLLKEVSADLQSRLENSVQKQEYAGLKGSLQALHDKLPEKIAGRDDDKLLKTVEKCLEQMESVGRQGQTTMERLEKFKGVVDAISSATQKHLEGCTLNETVSSNVEGRVSSLLEAMKTDICSQEDLTAKAASLQETVSVLEERLKTSEAKVSDLSSQAVGSQSRESTLKERADRSEATIATLQQNERLLSQQALQQHTERTKAEGIAHAARAQDLERRLSETETQLAEARQAVVVDFGPERAQLEEKAQRELENSRTKLNKIAQANQIRHTGELRQARAHKESIEKKLAAAIADLEPIKANNQLLQEQGTSSKNRVDSLLTESGSKEAQIRQLGTEITAERKKSEGLQRSITEMQATRRETDSTKDKLNEELREVNRDLNKRLIESDAAKQEVESRAGQAETGLREQSEKHQSEISTLRQTVEETNSRLKLVEDEKTRLEENLHSLSSSGSTEATTQTEVPGQVPVRKQLKRVDRNRPSQHIQSQRVQVLRSTPNVPETQVDEEYDDMLDDLVPDSQNGHAQTDPLAVRGNVDLRTRSSSPLSSHSSDEIYQQISAEETQANLASQASQIKSQASLIQRMHVATIKSQSQSVPSHTRRIGLTAAVETQSQGRTEQATPTPQRASAISQGKKRDPEPLHGSQTSQKRNQTRTLPVDDEIDNSDDSDAAYNPKKRHSSQRVHGSTSKRARVSSSGTTGSTNITPRAKSNNGRYASTPQGGSSSIRNSMARQTGTGTNRSSSNGGTSTQKSHSTRKNSKFDDRFGQELHERP